MNTNLIEKLDTYIQLATSKAGLAADHFWPMIVKQQYIEGIFGLICLIICVIGGFFVFKCFKNEDEKESNLILAIIIACFILILGAPVSIINVPKLISPEYYALKDVASMINPRSK